MPSGCFTILLPTDADHKVLGYYYADSSIKFEISNDLFLRLNLDHSKNEHNFLKLKEVSIVSCLYNFKGKLARKASGIILGLLIDNEEKPEAFKSPLKNAAAAIEEEELISLSREDFEAKLKEIYEEYLETLTDTLDPIALEENIKNRVKEMLSGSKKEVKIADELLKKIQNNEHKKISINYNSAEDAIKNEDYDKAAKLFGKAADLASDFLERDLSRTLKYKSKISNRIPIIIKSREKIIQDAMTALRNDNFHTAYVFFKKGAELSKELMDAHKEDEYNLKSKALQDFYNADQKYNKK